jgi:type I restriction enzyme S subunit
VSLTLKPYPEYKDSGLPWLGEIPAHWRTERPERVVKNVAEQINGRAVGDAYIALEHVESWTGKILSTNNDVEFESLVKRFELDDVLCSASSYHIWLK